MAFKKCQKSGIKKVPDGLEPQVWSFESARRLRATSLTLRKCQIAWSQKSGIKKVPDGLELEV